MGQTSILVVDESATQLVHAMHGMPSCTFQLAWAKNIRLAWRVLASRAAQYDIIAMDEALLHQGGREMLAKMRRIEWLEKIPVIIMVEQNKLRKKSLLEEPYIFDLIYKPLSIKLFLLLVAEALL